MSTSIQMIIATVFLSIIAILSLIGFFITGESECLFGFLCFGSGAVCVYAIRAKVWDKKNLIELAPNRYFWIAILILFLIECVFLYLYYIFIGDNLLSRITFFAKYGKYFVLLIPVWIVTLYNLKK